MHHPPRVGFLISGRGSNLPPMLSAIEAGRIKADTVALYSNRPDARGLQLARDRGIPAQVLNHQDFPDRDSFDRALHQQLINDGIELVVLAGFMRILGAEFSDRWSGRMLNIHPSLLPLYPGLDTHQRALDAGDSHAGASVHFVTPQLDGGPIIIQGKVPVKADDDADTLASRVLDIEHEIYPIALEWLTSGRLHLCDGQCLLDQTVMAQPALWQHGQLHFQSSVTP